MVMLSYTHYMNVNFAFVRHGHGCHNALRPLVSKGLVPDSKGLKIVDPELTPLGVDATTKNGCIISKVMMNLYKMRNDPALKMDQIDIVGCSPLIRAMESAYYMTRKWKNPPSKIYVFPLLREINEGATNKYSDKSYKVMEKTPSYAMRTLGEQKAYLESQGILDYFDFTFVEKQYVLQRKEPGDIPVFTRWFTDIVLPSVTKQSNQLNLMVVTHAGVLKDMAQEGFVNNDGFLLRTIVTPDKPITYKSLILFKDYLPTHFFDSYQKYTKSQYFCPSSRCGQLCTIMDNTPETRKRISTRCSRKKNKQ